MEAQNQKREMERILRDRVFDTDTNFHIINPSKAVDPTVMDYQSGMGGKTKAVTAKPAVTALVQNEEGDVCKFKRMSSVEGGRRGIYFTAIASISQRTPLGSSFTATQLLAGLEVK